VAYVLAATAAFVNALTSVLQRIGVETAPESTTMRWSLMAHALKRGIWLVGFGLMLVEFWLQATALRFGELSVVQPVLTTELLFLLLILGVWFRYHLGWQEWIGAATIVAGLGAFFLAAAPRGGDAIPSDRAFTMASVILTAAIVGCIFAALRGPRWWRAAAFGAATGVTAAFSAALTKSITTYVTEGWGHVFTHAQPYMLAVTGLGTVFLLQNALHAGPITASRTTLVTINPLVSIVLGITLFADRLRTGPVWTSLEVAALAVLVAGVVVLARSPLVAGTHEAGDLDEMLGGARHRATATATVVVGDGDGVGDGPRHGDRGRAGSIGLNGSPEIGVVPAVSPGPTD
jgi:drug/metabolite transporter (DMT)-like permease